MISAYIGLIKVTTEINMAGSDLVVRGSMGLGGWANGSGVYGARERPPDGHH